MLDLDKLTDADLEEQRVIETTRVRTSTAGEYSPEWVKVRSRRGRWFGIIHLATIVGEIHRRRQLRGKR